MQTHNLQYRHHPFHPPQHGEIVQVGNLNPHPMAPLNMAPTLVIRNSVSSDCQNGVGSPGCSSNDSSASTTPLLPIILGSIIPVIFAIVVLFYFHRRHVLRLRREELADDKDLDFGNLPIESSAKGGIDMQKRASFGYLGEGIDPYLLPTQLSPARAKESLTSLSRAYNMDDKYRAALVSSLYMRSADSDQMSRTQSPISSLSRAGSIDRHAGRSRLRTCDTQDDGMALIGEASEMPQGSPIESSPASTQEEFTDTTSLSPSSITTKQAPAVQGAAIETEERVSTSDERSISELSQVGELEPTGDIAPALSNDETVLVQKPEPAFISPPKDELEGRSSRASNCLSDASYETTTEIFATRPLSLHKQDEDKSIAEKHVSYYEDSAFGGQEIPHEQPFQETQRYADNTYMLPDGDQEIEESADQRASRIRSFYREYFEDSRSISGTPSRRPTLQVSDAPIWDKSMQHFVSQSMVRQPSSDDQVFYGQVASFQSRPRAVSATMNRVYSQSPAYGYYHGYAGGRSQSSHSGAYADSRASSNIGSSMGNGMVRRAHPGPLKPLKPLPAQHALDPIMDPLGFAPVKRGYVHGSAAASDSGSMTSHARAFSPSPYLLASSYTDLPDLPSPHHLRKSSTFTSLDFAPPRRIAQSEVSSDAGSIRSARTAPTRAAAHRGAGRSSRLADDLVPTKAEMISQLRPQWNQRS